MTGGLGGWHIPPAFFHPTQFRRISLRLTILLATLLTLGACTYSEAPPTQPVVQTPSPVIVQAQPNVPQSGVIVTPKEY